MALNAEEHTLTSQFEVLSAELTDAYRRELVAVAAPWERRRVTRVTVIGHASSELIRPRSQHIFADNYVLSAARARSVARYLSELLDVPMDQMQVEGRGPDEPVASNATEAGRILNRRAEVRIIGESFVGCLDAGYDSAGLAERRADLPTIGLRTVEDAVNAGLRGVAVEAGGTLIVDAAKVAERADAAGLFVIGVPIEP